jgi:2-amino-4-hydroxy-6-hydroxymethyldihydropteridine diphosphokinase
VKERVFIGLGSNVGRRPVFLRRAVSALKKTPGVRVVRVSPVYETSPVGPRQRCFLNAVLEVRSHEGPEDLLKRLQALERALGRRRRRRWGPREIDLDLLLFGRRRANRPGLTLPHPRWRERKFVLWPLADLAPRFRDPADGSTVAALRRKLTDPDQTIKLYR